MKYGEFMASLNRGELKHVYLLAGEEDYYVRKAKERLLSLLTKNSDAAAIERMDGNRSVDDIIAVASTVPFFTDKTVILVTNPTFLRESKNGDKEDEPNDAKKAADNKRADKLVKFLGDIPPTSYIIFELFGKADKRRRPVKAIEKYGAVLDAERVRPWTINEFLQSKLQEMNRDLTTEARDYFLEIASFMQPISLSFLDKEFDKLALFAKERRIGKKELAESFSAVPEVSNFTLADALVRKDLPAALKILMRQVNDGAYMPLVAAVIVNQVRRLLQMKFMLKKRMNQNEIAKVLEMNPYIVQNQLKFAPAFTEDKLVEALLNLADADYKMKTGGGGNELLESIVIKLCK